MLPQTPSIASPPDLPSLFDKQLLPLAWPHSYIHLQDGKETVEDVCFVVPMNMPPHLDGGASDPLNGSHSCLIVSLRGAVDVDEPSIIYGEAGVRVCLQALDDAALGAYDAPQVVLAHLQHPKGVARLCHLRSNITEKLRHNDGDSVRNSSKGITAAMVTVLVHEDSAVGRILHHS